MGVPVLEEREVDDVLGDPVPVTFGVLVPTAVPVRCAERVAPKESENVGDGEEEVDTVKLVVLVAAAEAVVSEVRETKGVDDVLDDTVVEGMEDWEGLPVTVLVRVAVGVDTTELAGVAVLLCVPPAAREAEVLALPVTLEETVAVEFLVLQGVGVRELVAHGEGEAVALPVTRVLAVAQPVPVPQGVGVRVLE